MSSAHQTPGGCTVQLYFQFFEKIQMKHVNKYVSNLLLSPASYLTEADWTVTTVTSGFVTRLTFGSKHYGILK